MFCYRLSLHLLRQVNSATVTSDDVAFPDEVAGDTTEVADATPHATGNTSVPTAAAPLLRGLT